MNHPINGRSGGQGVLEYPIPLREHQVARQQKAAALIPLADECEQHFHLVTVLLDVANVIDDDGIEPVELAQFIREIDWASESRIPQVGERSYRNRRWVFKSA